jgi:hypothetical protein
MRLTAPLRALLLAAGLGLLPAALTAEEELRLTTGEIIVGELVKENDESIEIRRMVLVKRTPVATNVIIPKIQVTRRQKVPPLAEQYQARIKDQPDTLLAQCAIARWCIEKCLMSEALVHTRKAEAEDTENPIVAKLYADLGYVRDEGAWVKEDEYLAKTGKVNYAGKIMTPEQAEKAKAIAKLMAERDTLQQQIRDADWSSTNGEDKLKDLNEKLAKAKEAQAKNKADGAGAKARVEQLTKRIAERTARQNNNNGGGNGRNQAGLENDKKELQEATATASHSAQEQAAADRAVADAEKRLTEMKTRTEKAKTELPAWKKRLEEVQAEIAKLTGKPVPGADKADGAKDGKDGDAAKGDKPGDKPTDEAAKPKSRFGN